MPKKPKKSREPTAQLFHYAEGRVVRGEKFNPLYSDWNNPSIKPHHDPRRRHYQELELFMLSNKEATVPRKDIAVKRGNSAKTVDKVIGQIRNTHDLPARTHGSKLPIHAQNAVRAIYENAGRGEKIQLLRVIYSVYKATGGRIISADSAQHILKELELSSKIPKGIKIGMWKIGRTENVGVIKEKIKLLEQMEREGKLPWPKPFLFK